MLLLCEYVLPLLPCFVYSYIAYAKNAAYVECFQEALFEGMTNKELFENASKIASATAGNYFILVKNA